MLRPRPEALEEYLVNIDLWKHDDTLRQARNQTYLTISSALLVASGLIFQAVDQLLAQGITAVVAGVLGVMVCRGWRNMQARLDAYVRFRRLHLANLEEELGFTTLKHVYSIFHDGETVDLGSRARAFRAVGRETKSASAAEARVPDALMWLWAVSVVVGFGLVVYSAL